MKQALHAFVAVFVCALPGISLADGGQDQGSFAVTEEQASQPTGTAGGTTEDKSTVNFKKTGRFLPGEETVTPTGKKVKVWSTEGPVPVSRAPEPFEDREKSTLNGGAAIVVDVDGRRIDHRDQPVRREPEYQPDTRNR